MAETKPVVFMSFVASDFQHDDERNSRNRELLTDEASMHAGEELSIYEDRDDAIWAPLKGGGDIEDNDLPGNAYGAWKVSDESDPLLKRTGNLE